MKFGAFVTALMIVVGIYLLPSVLARFIGTHTVEVNQTEGVQGLNCYPCHGYVFQEMNQSMAQAITQKHRTATGNYTYTLSWLQRNLSDLNQSTEGVCYLCHTVIKKYENESHSGVVIRVCTDINCHGNNETTNNTMYSVGNASMVLGGVGAHAEWFDDMSKYASSRANETNVNYTASYWACLGCHTYVGFNQYLNKTVYNHSNQNFETKRYV